MSIAFQAFLLIGINSALCFSVGAAFVDTGRYLYLIALTPSVPCCCFVYRALKWRDDYIFKILALEESRYRHKQE